MELEKMGKAELRAACKKHGIKYSGLKTVAGMRTALDAALSHAKREPATTAVLTDEFVEEFKKGAPQMRTELEKVEAKVFDDADNDGADARLLNLDADPSLDERCEHCGGWHDGEPCQMREPSKSETVVKPQSKRRVIAPEQHGIRAPLRGVCQEVWAFCTEWKRTTGSGPEWEDVKAHADKVGWNRNNASIELSRWRKFHGYARQKST